MALKFKINKAGYEKLGDDLKKEYIAGEGEGEFVLDVSDLPQGEDVGPIKRALESEKAKYKTLKADRDTLKAKVDDMPDVDALTKTHEAETGKLKTFAEKTLKDAVAMTLATKISTTPKLLAKEIATRIGVDMTGDEPKTVFLGADGKPNAELTIEKLQQEFVANPEYKSIIIASKASGGGAPKPTTNSNGGGAPVGEQSGTTPPDLSKMDPNAFAARIAARKEAEATNAAAT